MKKSFYGAISLAARINFDTEADSKEEVEEKLMSAECLEIKLFDENGNEVDFNIQDIEWNLIMEAQRGNIQESYIEDVEIYEEDEE
ncbi:hypothetical protein [Clostridium baratii]|uniref:hypothetical protein n=1 Tax=Clostridium baratii TaxID=1561 RepID=UPI0030D3418D